MRSKQPFLLFICFKNGHASALPKLVGMHSVKSLIYDSFNQSLFSIYILVYYFLGPSIL